MKTSILLNDLMCAASKATHLFVSVHGGKYFDFFLICEERSINL